MHISCTYRDFCAPYYDCEHKAWQDFISEEE